MDCDRDLRTLLDDFRDDLVGDGRRPRGVDGYVAGARQLLAWVGKGEAVAAAQLTPAAITRWRNERAKGCAASTVHADLCIARCFCRFLMGLGHLEADPTARVKFPKPQPKPPRPLSADEVRAMLAALDVGRLPREHRHTAERARLGVYVFLYSGLRLAEVAALRWSDVDLDGGSLVVREGKGGRSRGVPLHPRLRVELEAAARELGPELRPRRAVIGNRSGGAMHPKSVAEIFTRWLKARGVVITAHRLRHTFATAMLRAGAPLPDIQQALGHASLETTQIYLLVEPSHLRRAVELLPDTW